MGAAIVSLIDTSLVGDLDDLIDAILADNPKKIRAILADKSKTDLCKFLTFRPFRGITVKYYIGRYKGTALDFAIACNRIELLQQWVTILDPKYYPSLDGQLRGGVEKRLT